MRKAGTPIIKGITYQLGINRFTVAQRDGWRCQQCGVKVIEKWDGDNYDERTATVGHWPAAIANGGTHTWDNVQCQCHGCNARLGTQFLSIEDYKAGQVGMGL